MKTYTKFLVTFLTIAVIAVNGCVPSPTATPPQMQPVSPDGSSGPALTPFEVDLTRPFAVELSTGEPVTLQAWEAKPYASTEISLPVDLEQVANAAVLNGLTDAQRAFLERNGFVVIHSQEEQFGDIRVSTARRTGQSYYLTTDAAFHALHLLFDELLKALEHQYFRPQMANITAATLQEAQDIAEQLQGTSLEAEAGQAVAYLSVALKLFDPQAQTDASQSELVARQVEQILAAGGRDYSALFPDFEDDYGAYKPVGHYAGDPELEAYFRGMTWYGRMHFLLDDPDNPNFVPSRLPLIVTLGLRRAQINGDPAAQAWADIYKTLNFVIGPSDDAGPLEYAELMDAVYGTSHAAPDLADDQRWQAFLNQSKGLPAPQINSLFIDSTLVLSSDKGWRFMGQRFTLDGLVFQNMIFDRVQKRPDGEQRDFPSGLDVMAAFGSSLALSTLEDLGETNYPNYSAQMTKMQQAVESQPEAQWLGRFYDAWLYSFFPLLKQKDASFPAYMQTKAWSFKDLNTALGSWAELKHDTILYTKMPEGAGGGGPPMSAPGPSYVEPNPVAFYRMAYMSRALGSGLEQRLFLYSPSEEDLGSGLSVDQYVSNMYSLGDKFEAFGDIAAKELAGEPLTEDENWIITDCLGMIECMNQESPYNLPAGEMPKPPIIAAVSGAQDKVLEVGIGWVDRLYVVLPLEDQMQVAQGGVFSYYEFLQPRDQRLTDEEWREKLSGGQAPSLPAWAANFVLPGGEPTEWLAFRVGDVYIITESGDELNVRESASTQSAVLRVLQFDDYIEITDGPVMADGYIWWQVAEPSGKTLGWAVEDQDWYERSYLP
ncbi:MAG: DUF3160 domain-containing protein [Anaerolineales bacterium]|nr:DUF3160 domain-containing protein [Anaerolineales bacterium]